MARYIIFVFIVFLCMSGIRAQDVDPQPTKPRPIRSTFDSPWIIDNQSVDVSHKHTLTWDIQHRFGIWKNGYEDYFGLAAPSNIRLGFAYVPIENLQIGFGITKERKFWDFSAKYVIVKQKRSNGSPISLAYFGSGGYDSRDFDDFQETSDRFSYFNQIILARKFSDRISWQISPGFSYFNFPEKLYSIEGELLGTTENKHFSISTMGRVKVSDVVGIMLGIDIPLTEHDFIEPENNISMGFEFVTSSHVFQLFVGNYQSLIPQYNSLLNQNKFGDGEILIGFNIVRFWNL